ncbi:hypothetical protein PFLUV_G00227020 [Perca fluviatilis]|uniref:Uncharacterized protein n=1 Tax=Perca fluviatilis TaxID=8168 RepID=A0A6A5ECC2_PERFL|nr:hypothetical protein PFLUV_G00241830 [Perca fluviatilis]KAF1376091.1 hypothetical protein PFLUV_G00227020 [Perca fluviatilis]
MPPANSWRADCFTFSGGCLCLMDRGRLVASRFEIQGYSQNRPAIHSLNDGSEIGYFQRLQNENQALREENHTLRESNARAASDDSGSLQEQVKQVGTMLKTFACTWQSGADQTLMLRRLGEFGDVVRSMDNKMETMQQHFSANVSVGEPLMRRSRLTLRVT